MEINIHQLITLCALRGGTASAESLEDFTYDHTVGAHCKPDTYLFHIKVVDKNSIALRTDTQNHPEVTWYNALHPDETECNYKGQFLITTSELTAQEKFLLSITK